MLRIKTTEVEGESFTIQQMSAFRVMSLERKAREAAGDNDAMVAMIVDTLQRCVLVSESDPQPRYMSDEDMDDLSLPQMIALKEAIIEFSQEPVAGGKLADAVEDEVKN